MADDYLGRKMEEYLQRPTQSKKRSRRLVDLLRRNRSHRAYEIDLQAVGVVLF